MESGWGLQLIPQERGHHSWRSHKKSWWGAGKITGKNGSIGDTFVSRGGYVHAVAEVVFSGLTKLTTLDAMGSPRPEISGGFLTHDPCAWGVLKGMH